MKITDIEVIWLRVPSLEAYCEWGDDAVLVRIHTDAGITGIGESDSSPSVVKAVIEAPISHSTCMGLKHVLIGQNPLEINRLWDAMFTASEYMGRRGVGIHAISAIDIALWDIAGKYYGVPVHTLLGGKHRESINAYGTFIPSSDAIESAARARKLVEDGFRSLKFGGNGFGIDPLADYKTVLAIRDAVGPAVELQIDLVGLWKNFAIAKQRFEMLKEFNLNWIEEPVPSDSLKCYRRLSESLPVKVTGGEALSTYPEFKQFIEEASPAIVQPDITRCGGISEMRKINQLAESSGVSLVPHGFSTGVLLHATVHFLAATKFGDLIEYSQSESLIYKGLLKNMLPMQEGQVIVPDEPGLGIELDELFIEKYRVSA